MSDLVQKLLDASDKSDGWDAWTLAPIAAEYIKELEAEVKKLQEALPRVSTKTLEAMQAIAIAKAKRGGQVMSKHTPGPWGFDSFALREEIRAENNPLIATVCSVHCDTPEEMRANARLIAAAPELLWTLEKLVERVGGDEWFAEWAGMARAAIAKAKGEE